MGPKMTIQQQPSFWELYPEKANILKKLWAQGTTPNIIARILAPQGGLTRNAVIGKARRLGMRHVQRRVGATQTAPVKHKHCKRLHILPEVMMKAINKDGSPPPMPPPAPGQVRDLPYELPATAVSLYDIGQAQCRWPVGHPAELLFCGAVTVPESKMMYCPEHCRRATSISARQVNNVKTYIPFRR